MKQLEFITIIDLVPIIPEIIVLVTACMVLLVDLFTSNKEHRESIRKILPTSVLIGRITSEKTIFVTDKDGKNINFKKLGWDSF